MSLEKGKIIEKEWNNDKLSLMINGCINIEKNINDIGVIKTKIKNCYSNNKKEIEFYPEESEINSFLMKLKSLEVFLNVIYNLNGKKDQTIHYQIMI